LPKFRGGGRKEEQAFFALLVRFLYAHVEKEHVAIVIENSSSGELVLGTNGSIIKTFSNIMNCILLICLTFIAANVLQ